LSDGVKKSAVGLDSDECIVVYSLFDSSFRSDCSGMPSRKYNLSPHCHFAGLVSRVRFQETRN
jgi:hypothetical protein